MMRIRTLFGVTFTAIFLLLFSFVAAQTKARHDGGAAADTVLEKIVLSYENGAYVDTELEGRRRLEGGGLTDSVHVQVEKYIAFSLIAQEKPRQASSHFTALLQIDSTFDLDPLLTSPKILAVFHEAREKFFTQRAATFKSGPSPIVQGQISYRAIVFPGWEQLYRGRTETGIAFLAVGAASLVSTIYCDFKRRDLRTSYLDAPTTESAIERYRSYDNFQKAEIYSGATFVVAYIVSEIEIFHAASHEAAYSARFAHHNGCAILTLNIPF